MVGIYKITNTINNKVYIGQAGKGNNTIKGRFKAHKYGLKRNNHSNKHLQLSWNKYTKLYGDKCFTFEIIEECNKQELDIMETYWICYYKSYDNKYGYNKDFGGSSGLPTKETKIKMSESAKGKILSEVTKKKLSEANTGKNNPNFGKKLSESTRKKISEANKITHTGKIHSEETKKKMSESHKGIITWNKNLTKNDSDILKKIGEKNSIALKGRVPWNKGLTKETNDIVKEMGKKAGKTNKGRVCSEECKKRISKAQKGEKSHRYGISPANKINFTDEQINDILIRIIKKENKSEIARDYNCSESTLKNIKWRYKDLFKKLETRFLHEK